MKKLVLILSFALAGSALAHDEGHGPKLNDQPQHGGVRVSPVVPKGEASKGPKATLIHKAELVVSGSSAKIFLYDVAMKPLAVKGFDKSAKGILWFKKSPKDKKATRKEFALAQDEATSSYSGTMPEHGKPFSFDFEVKGNGKDLLSAFDNLD